jgi:uncharacterized protein YraI
MKVQPIVRNLALPGAILAVWLLLAPLGYAGGISQQPTGTIPTVTATISGPVITVNSDQATINVRSGPSTDYPKIGVLVAGEQAVALGRTPGGDWIQIVYPGVPEGVAWVYSGLVTVGYGDLPVIEPPPTPTPQTTPTTDPTLAAQFDIAATPTRLPTFTPPPPVSNPTFEEPVLSRVGNAVPIGLVILALAVIGMFGFLLSLLRRR